MSAQSFGPEGDTTRTEGGPAGMVYGEGGIPAGFSFNPFRAPIQTPEPPPDWRDWASCRETDPEVFHPEKGKSVAPAKRVCANCPVRFECLEYALDHDMRFGVWGGLSERERRVLRRRSKTRTDIAVRRAHVARLTAAGLDSEAIAAELRMTARQVCRDRAAVRAAS